MRRLILAVISDEDKRNAMLRLNHILQRIGIATSPTKIMNSLANILSIDDINDCLDNFDIIAEYIATFDLANKYKIQYRQVVSDTNKLLNALCDEKTADRAMEILLKYAEKCDNKFVSRKEEVTSDELNAAEMSLLIKNNQAVLDSIFTSQEINEIKKYTKSILQLQYAIDKQIKVLVSAKTRYPGDSNLPMYINEFKTLFLNAIAQNDLGINNRNRNDIITKVNSIASVRANQKQLDVVNVFKQEVIKEFIKLGNLVGANSTIVKTQLDTAFEKITHLQSNMMQLFENTIIKKYLPGIMQSLNSDAVKRAAATYSKMQNAKAYTLKFIFLQELSKIDNFRVAYSANALLKTWLETFQLNEAYLEIFRRIHNGLYRVSNKEIPLTELNEEALQWLKLDKEQVMANIVAAQIGKVTQTAIFKSLYTLYDKHNMYDIILKKINDELQNYKQLVIDYFMNINLLQDKNYRFNPQNLVPVLNAKLKANISKIKSSDVDLNKTDEELEKQQQAEQNWLNEYSAYMPPFALDYFQNKIYPIRNAKIIGEDGTLFDYNAFIKQCKKLYISNTGNKRKDAFEAYFRNIERNFGKAIKEWKDTQHELKTHSKRIQYLNELAQRDQLTGEAIAFIEAHSKHPYLDIANAINVWAVAYYENEAAIKGLLQSTAEQALAQITAFLNQTNEDFKRMDIPQAKGRLPDYLAGCAATYLKPELLNSFDGIVMTQKQAYEQQNKPFDGFNVVRFLCNIVLGLTGDKLQIDNSWMRKNFANETELLPKDVQEGYKRYKKRQNDDDSAAISDFEAPKSQTPEELRTPKEKKQKEKDPWSGRITSPSTSNSEYFEKYKVKKNQNNGRGNVWTDQTSLKSLEQTMRIDQWKAENNKIGKTNRLLKYILG